MSSTRWRFRGGKQSLWVVLTLLTLTILLIWSAGAAEGRTEWVAHTLAVLKTGAEVESRLWIARSLPPGSDRDTQLTELHNRLKDLHALTADNPTQARRSRQMMALLEGAGKQQTRAQLDRLASVHRQFQDQEAELLIARRRDEAVADSRFRSMAALALLVNAAVGLWIAITGRRRAAERDEAARRIQQLNERLVDQNGQLENRVDEKTRALAQAVLDLELANAELERFAYIAAHDLQEPLRQVAGFNGLLARKYGGVLNEQARGYVSRSISGVKRLEALTKGLLSYSSITKAEMQCERTRLEPLIRGAMQEVEDELRAAGADVTLRLEQDREEWVDSAMVRRLVRELVANAVKFRQPGRPPQVQVSLRADEQASAWMLEVSDNGIGLDERFAAQAVHVFSRLHPPGQYEGAGVGLAVSRKILAYHGGKLSISANAGGGTIFTGIVPFSATSGGGRRYNGPE